MTQARREAAVLVTRHRAAPVTAVLVTCGLSEYVPETLAAVAAQTAQVQHLLLVDVTSDGPDPELEDLVARTWTGENAHLTLVSAPGARTFGDGVRSALEQVGDAPAPRAAAVGASTAATATATATASTRTSGTAPRVWLWLLHDDSAPAPTALAELLRAVDGAPSVAVAGCKQRSWSQPSRVVEVGLATSRFGRRMTGIDEPEVDQGQYDGREDVLGVGIAGALVRRDVWDALGGTDPALGPYGDGLDLSRRARLAGHRVVVVPRAVVRHAQASLARPTSGAVVNRHGWDARRSAQARREAYLHTQLTGVPAALVPVVAVLALVSGVVRALGRLVVKEPHLVVAELLAPWAVLARPRRILRARRTARAGRRLHRRALRPLQVTWRDVLGEAQDRRLTAVERRRTRQAPSELELTDLRALRARRRGALAGVAVVAVALSAAVLGPLVTRVTAGSRLTGGSLIGGDSTLAELWGAATSGWVLTGLGSPGPADPMLVALLPLTALTGSAGAATALVLLGALVAGALGAWFAAGAATRSTALRAWAALVWVGAPALLLALTQARPGAVLAHVALPWVALGVARAIGVARADVVESGLVGARRRRPVVAAATVAAPQEVALGTGVRSEEAWRAWREEGDPDEDASRADDDPTSSDEDASPADDDPTSPDRDPTSSEGDTAALEARDGRAVADPHPGPGARTSASGRSVREPVSPRQTAPVPGIRTLEPSLAAAAGAGLAFTVVSAAAPVLLPFGLLALLAVAAATGRRRRLLWVALPAVVVHGPLLVQAASTWVAGGWRLLVAEPGLPQGSVGTAAWRQLLGWPVDPPQWWDLPDGIALVAPLVATGVVLAVAVVALITTRSGGRAVRVGWVVVACGLAAAVVAARVEVGVADGETGAQVVTAWPGPGLSLALVGLLTAALVGAGGLRSGMVRHGFGWRQLGVSLLAVLAVVGPAVTLGTWAWHVRGGGEMAIGATEVPVVPAAGRQMQLSPDGVRVLALEVDASGVVRVTLLRQDGVQLTEMSRAVTAREVAGLPGVATVAEPDAADRELADVAGRLATGSSDDVAVSLAGLAVGAVLVPEDDTDAHAALVGRIDSTRGLERVTETASGVIWRVAAADVGSTSAWARLVDGSGIVDGAVPVPVAAQGGTIDTQLPEGGGQRILVLAERADAGWHATVDGRPLRAVGSSWRQSFEVGPEGGRLVVNHAQALRTPWLVLQGLVLLMAVLLALPVRRRRGAPR